MRKRFAECRVVHVSRVEEDRDCDGHASARRAEEARNTAAEPASVTVYADEGPRNLVRRALDEALAAAAGMEEMVRCQRC